MASSRLRRLALSLAAWVAVVATIAGLLAGELLPNMLFPPYSKWHLLALICFAYALVWFLYIRLVAESLREGLARALPQAMLCGKPAVSFDVDGAREVVNERTGRLIEPKNIGQLVDACAELIEDADLRRQLGENGRELVKEMFSPDRMVDTIETVYRKLLGQE